MSFRILNQAPQYLLPSGQVNAGGKLYTYETDLTTLKDTWSDEAMTVLNSNPVLMDAAGRTVTDVWGDGEYGVVMTDADDVEIWTRNNVRPDAGAGAVIPALVTGQFLTNDGSVLQWQPVLQPPDPTGSNGYFLTTDGANLLWTPPADPPDPDIVVGTGSFQAGVSSDPTKYLRQYGADSAPASGGVLTQKAVVFPTPYTATPVIQVTNAGGTTAAGYYVDVNVIAQSATGFTVAFNGDHGIANGSGNILAPIPFGWSADGTVEVP